MAKSKADPAGGVSKVKMVTGAIDELGDVNPKELQAYISQKYGVEIGTTMISSYKSNILRKRGGSGGGRGGSGGGNVGVRDIALIRELIDRVGANQLQTLVKVLSK